MPATATARVKPSFVKRIRDDIGMTYQGIGAAAGVSRQYAEQVISGKAGPSVGFMSGLIRAGLARSFDEIAEPITNPEEEQP